MDQNADTIAKAIKGSLKIIDQAREREIVSRRFGLNGQKETLEQIGDMLSITRERVRQLEKAILIRLRICSEEGEIPALAAAEKLIIRNLTEMGRVARVSDLADKIYGRPTTAAERAEIAFIGDISSSLSVIDENDSFYNAIGITEYGTAEQFKKNTENIVSLIKKTKHPLTIDELDKILDYEHPSHIIAIASISKKLATLNGAWGLAKWPTVNPKNIRDKIFVVLENQKEPMHFADIAAAIADSDFRRKDVTVQAIHNELIKDDRFVLIGRGIYALDSWGYKKGTVSDIIIDILKKADKPVARIDIVRQVLRARKVKETTILLNLQNKKLFKKVDKNSYVLVKD